MNKFAATSVLSVVTATLLLSSCATYTGQTNDPNDPNRTQRGALIGAGIGAVAGLLSGGDAVERRQRALVGAGIGGIAGGSIGAYQDRQEAALRQRMAGTGVQVNREGDNITLNMPGNITFAFNSSNLDPQFYPVLDGVAQTLTEYNQTVVEVAGHTDNVGSDAYNQTLSVQRATSVANYLMGKGLTQQRFIVTGAGETRPIASNDTEAGRAANRRVEITLVPVHQ
ncbi:OmpA family protein [Pseudoluteimonas lycopersici]|uniref:OmpA family protein n=1 Tax=Pseudoluteimonas lycopersici TaxID=1324796 RepID=A0A516V2W7_9GAMM|nr:OmpA family protein [Lysobacter lycopersici]QDQ72847.1 OmpA family protein [Lysobacter lycopersici]